MRLRGTSRVHFYPLTRHRRISDTVVAYEPAGAYLTLDEDGMRILKALQKDTVGAVEKRFPETDVRGFVTRLVDAGLVHRIDHRVVGEKKHIASVLHLRPEHLQWTKHPIATGSAVAFLLLGFGLFLTRPALTPSSDWFWIFPQLSLLLIAALAAYWLTSLVHELGHYLLLRRTGHATGLWVVHKWHLLLPVADLRSGEFLPRDKRLLVHAGGILAQFALLTAASVFILADVGADLWRFLALITFLDILVQLSPLPKTDLSMAAQQYFGIQDLPGTVAYHLRTGCRHCKDLPKKVKHALEQFFPLAIIGSVLLAVGVLAYGLPIFLELLRAAWSRLLAAGISGDGVVFADSLLSLLLLSLFGSFTAVSMIREHHLTVRQWFSYFTLLGFLLMNYFAVFLVALGALFFAGPVASTVAFFAAGVLFGLLLIRLLQSLSLAQSRSRHLVLAVSAAATAGLLAVMILWISAHTGAPGTPLHGVWYAAGMLASTIF